MAVVKKTTTKKGHHFPEGDKKVFSFLKKKYGDTISCRPGDTNPSDATDGDYNKNGNA